MGPWRAGRSYITVETRSAFQPLLSDCAGRSEYDDWRTGFGTVRPTSASA